MFIFGDHPRSRGVYPDLTDTQRAAVGSSPLARGLRHRVMVRPDHVRIIPARAGFTAPSVAPSRTERDHPRSRGVYPLDPRAAAFIAGSSPLARGLLADDFVNIVAKRIIPARAGFTSRKGGPPLSRTDHPRSRGVYRQPGC